MEPALATSPHSLWRRLSAGWKDLYHQGTLVAPAS